jgi:hypothetical protein
LITYTWPAFGGPQDIRFSSPIASTRDDPEYGLITFYESRLYLPNDANGNFIWQTSVRELRSEDAIDWVSGGPSFHRWECNKNPEALVARMLRMAPEWPKWVAEQKTIERGTKNGNE